MIIPNEDLRTLCIKMDWFTCGSNRQYERLFQANTMGMSIDDITTVIWICSDEVPKYKIRETLIKAQKEYDDVMERAELDRWDVKTLQEFAKRLKEHYPHTQSIQNTIDKELAKMLMEVKDEKAGYNVKEVYEYRNDKTPYECLTNVLQRWDAFCKTHQHFEKAIKDILVENERLRTEIEELKRG